MIKTIRYRKISYSIKITQIHSTQLTIAYQIPERDFVTLKVYDILGREVATLVNEEKQAGSYEVQFEGRGLTSGIYFYQLKTGTFVETKKMILLR